MKRANSAKPTLFFFEDDQYLVELCLPRLSQVFSVTHWTKPPHNVVDLVATKRPQLILTDVIMPDMNGFELTQALKGDRRTDQIPVIGWDTLSQRDDFTTAKKAGMTEYWLKSKYTPDQITHKLCVFAGLQRPTLWERINGLRFNASKTSSPPRHKRYGLYFLVFVVAANIRQILGIAGHSGSAVAELVYSWVVGIGMVFTFVMLIITNKTVRIVVLLSGIAWLLAWACIVMFVI